MNNIAGKFQTLSELFDSGLLCNCTTYDFIEGIDADGNETFNSFLIHDSDCTGPAKAKELLNTKETV